MENKNQDILSYLQSSFLFRGLSTQYLQEIAQKTRLRTYRIAQPLIEEGEISDKIIVIIHGLVKIYKLTPEGKEVFLAYEKTNDYLGVMDLGEKPGSATVEALQPTKALIFSKKDLLALLEKHPFLWERMYRIVLAKLEELREFQRIRLSHDLYQRTFIFLQHLSQFSGNDTVILSQEIIASMVGATRPRVTEALHALRDAKKINVSPKKITILA